MKPTFLVGVIGLALTGVIGYHGLYVRQQERAHLIHAQAEQEQAKQDTQQELASLLIQIEQYRKRLPPEPDPSWLVREAVAFGQKAGLELTTIAKESPQQFQQFTRLAISVQFTATYHQLGTFLDYLESSDRFIRVEHLEMSSPKETEGKASIRLVLSTVYLPPLVNAGSTPSAH